MKKVILYSLSLFLVIGAVEAATERASAARVGTMGGARMSARPSSVGGVSVPDNEQKEPGDDNGNQKDKGHHGNKNEKEPGDGVVEAIPETTTETSVEQPVVAASSTGCRDAYRDCMDQFCLLDESEGERCACSANIEKSKSLIKKINDTQAAAEKLYNEGVEKEKLGAKAVIVFGSSDKAKNSRVDLSAWLNTDDEEGMDTDSQLGQNLYSMAAESCKEKLAACGTDAKMEEMLYDRQVTADCKAFTSFLAEQQKVADTNKAAAEKAVRVARFEELGNTNKYNRGECLIALRNCVAEKGGCGDNFENCLDEGLLSRRTNACQNITDQCMAVKKDVMNDWEEETKQILADAVKYADKYKRQTCLSKIENCLEDSCATGSNDQCLNNVDVASGVCPIITECNELIPGITSVINDKLGYLRVRFCQNDIESCFREKCGTDYTKPECLGKSVQEIAKLCPQDMYPSCKGQKQFSVLVSSIFLQMDYAMMQGCVNKFSDDLGKVCGTDMSCLPDDPAIMGLTSVDDARELFKADPETGVLKWRQFADTEVDKFFATLEADSTIGACADTQNPKTKVAGKNSIGRSVFSTAKMIAKINAENRQYRALTSKMRELAKAADLEVARKACELMKDDKKIDSVVFEPALRNCHICRTQEVCEEGGQSAAAGALQAASGGLAAGASAGTMVSPGWGTAIGGLVGGVGAGIMGGMASGKKTFCQEVQSCEDINM